MSSYSTVKNARILRYLFTFFPNPPMQCAFWNLQNFELSNYVERSFYIFRNVIKMIMCDISMPSWKQITKLFWKYMSLVAHRFGRVEVRIFVLIFSTTLACKKQQQILEIRNLTRPIRWATKDIRDSCVQVIRLKYTRNIFYLLLTHMVEWQT